MRRLWKAALAGAAMAVLIAACSERPPTVPDPVGGGPPPGGSPPDPPNTAPVVKAITVSDTRVEVGSPVTLTATVEDAETPVANLAYAWSVPNGTISGSGATVQWTPGEEAVTPGDFIVTLTVTESYASGGAQRQNTASGETSLHVNNSSKELRELSLRFLGDFANSKVSPEKCVAEFSDSCRGKKDEFTDIDNNRHDYEILASTLRHTSLSVASNRLTATVHTFCSFTSKMITTDPREENCKNGKCPLGSIGTTTGTCTTTNVYQNGRWWLCTSSYASQSGVLSTLERAFFGIKPSDPR
jgi:hypothetical protein